MAFLIMKDPETVTEMCALPDAAEVGKSGQIIVGGVESINPYWQQSWHMLGIFDAFFTIITGAYGISHGSNRHTKEGLFRSSLTVSD